MSVGVTIALGPNSPLNGLTARGCRDEAAEEQLCDDFVARASGTRGVVRFSQPRESMQTIGISDRRYRLCGVAVFFEVKADDGKLTASQQLFLLDELLAGAYASCGTLEDLEAFATVARSHPLEGRHGRLMDHCRQTIARWSEKGFRKERPSRKQRRRR